MKATESLHLTYKLTGVGWSECTIRAGEHQVVISASYLSHALGRLVMSALAIADGCHAVEFGFDEEPGEYRWVLQTVANRLMRLRLLWFDDLWTHRPTEEGKVLLDVNMEHFIYVEAVEVCARAVLLEHGAEGYLEKWADHPFPERELALLSDYLAEWRQNSPR